VFGTGLGSYDTASLDGVATPGSGSYGLIVPVQIKAGDTILLPKWAGAASGSVGVSAIRFRIAENLPHGVTVHLTAVSNGVESNIVLLPLE